MTFNLPSNFKNLVILIIVNMCIIFAVYSIYSDIDFISQQYDGVSLTFNGVNKAFFICFKSRHSNTIKN
jgi:hypothetical protein